MMLIEALFSVPLIGVSRRWPGRLHAVESREIIRAWPNGTVAAVCGARRLRLLGDGDFAVAWPPSTRGLPRSVERCQACWEATGKKRPRSKFRAAA